MPYWGRGRDRLSCTVFAYGTAQLIGDAENARLENAGLELSAPYYRAWKLRTGIIWNRKRMERHMWHVIRPCSSVM